jgi:hypothetical protein
MFTPGAAMSVLRMLALLLLDARLLKYAGPSALLSAVTAMASGHSPGSVLATSRPLLPAYS